MLQVALPGRMAEAAGVIVYDADQERLAVKLRRDWDSLAEPEDAEVLSQMEGHLQQMVREMGARQALEWLEGTLSHVLTLGEREEVSSGSLEFTLHQLYRQHVPVRVKPFETHLPRYEVRSAAGGFGEPIADPNSITDWVEAPADLRLSKDMFVCEVYGRSMEPLVPSGSLCVFRHFGGGSRNGKRVLVEDRSESANRYTLKVYRSSKQASGESDWRHEAISLEPLNPEFPILRLEPDEDRYAVLAEFVRVL